MKNLNYYHDSPDDFEKEFERNVLNIVRFSLVTFVLLMTIVGGLAYFLK